MTFGNSKMRRGKTFHSLQSQSQNNYSGFGSTLRSLNFSMTSSVFFDSLSASSPLSSLSFFSSSSSLLPTPSSLSSLSSSSEFVLFCSTIRWASSKASLNRLASKTRVWSWQPIFEIVPKKKIYYRHWRSVQPAVLAFGFHQQSQQAHSRSMHDRNRSLVSVSCQ